MTTEPGRRGQKVTKAAAGGRVRTDDEWERSCGRAGADRNNDVTKPDPTPQTYRADRGRIGRAWRCRRHADAFGRRTRRGRPRYPVPLLSVQDGPGRGGRDR